MNLTLTPTTATTYPRFLRVWSIVTLAAALVTVLVGTLVTTFHVGMADPLWPTAPWHLLLNENVPNFGFYVEHTHRITGYLIGTTILVLTVGLWWSSPSTTRRWASVASVAIIAVSVGYGMTLVRHSATRSAEALLQMPFAVSLIGAAIFVGLAIQEVQSRVTGRWQRFAVTLVFLGVIVQGLLGGLRVYLNELLGKDLSVIHGVVAQLVLALCSVLALMTTVNWNSLTDQIVDRPLAKLAAATAILILVQIFFGGLLRHVDLGLARRVHPLLAFAVLAAVAWMMARISAGVDGGQTLRRGVHLLLALILVQAALGIEAWLRTADALTRFQPVEVLDAAMRSAHVLTGFAIFSTSVWVAAQAWKTKLI